MCVGVTTSKMMHGTTQKLYRSLKPYIFWEVIEKTITIVVITIPATRVSMVGEWIFHKQTSSDLTQHDASDKFMTEATSMGLSILKISMTNNQRFRQVYDWGNLNAPVRQKFRPKILSAKGARRYPPSTGIFGPKKYF